MKVRKILSVLVLTAGFVSCTLSPFETEIPPEKEEESTIAEASSLFEESSDGNRFIFETNDSKYLKADGYTLWTTKYTNASENFETVTVKTAKEKGRQEAGYGIVFCSQETGGKLFMLTVLINENGLYTVGKINNGVFSHINNGWKYSSYISKGSGINNTISVSYDEQNKEFVLKINGYLITTFTAGEEISFKNSRSGFVVVIANNENFPEVPVRVIFEK